MHSRQTLPQRFHLDIPLLLAILVLAGIGLVVLYSAGGEDTGLIVKQGVRFLVALGLMLLVAQIAPQHLAYWTPWFYAGSLGLLILVLVVGDVGKGAQRWLDLGVLRFQPSEMVKVAVPAMVAWYLSERALPPSLPRLLVAAAIIVVPTALIAKQPDLGTSLLVAAAGVFVLLVAGMSWRLILAMGALCAAFLPALWYFFMHDYQRQRVLTLLNPQSDPLGAGYHIIQSKIAVGSGGVFGKGWLNGTQSQLDFVPERATDFIFAVFSEEFGLVGSLGLLTLYLFIVVRGLFLAAEAQETFGRLLGAGLVLTFFVYVFVNIGMVTGLLPVVGVPLPLISYGGTSMVTLMLAFGILMSVHGHRRLLSD